MPAPIREIIQRGYLTVAVRIRRDDGSGVGIERVLAACACEVLAPHAFGARLLARRWIAGCDSATERRSATPASYALLPAGYWASVLGLSLPLIRRGGRGARSCARSACVPTCASAACVYWARNLLHLGVPKCAEEDGVYLVFLVCVLQFLSTCPIGVRI